MMGLKEAGWSNRRIGGILVEAMLSLPIVGTSGSAKSSPAAEIAQDVFGPSMRIRIYSTSFDYLQGSLYIQGYH